MKAILLALVLATVQISASAFGQTASNSEIAKSGKLRCGMIAIRVLGGVAHPVCKFFADQLGVSFEPVVYSSPDAYAQSFGKGEWDIAVGPRVLAPTDKADVTADLWLIPLIYVAAPGHDFADATQVDRPGVKIGTIQGSPSDRFLSHNVKLAEIVRIQLSPHISVDVADLLKSGKVDVFGGDAGVGYPAAETLAGGKNRFWGIQYSAGCRGAAKRSFGFCAESARRACRRSQTNWCRSKSHRRTKSQRRPRGSVATRVRFRPNAQI